MLAGIVAVTVAVAALGGFRPATDEGADAAVGEWLELTRWDARVDSCRVVLQPDREPEVQLGMTVVNRWQQSQPTINDNAWQIRLPNGEIFGAGGEYLSLRDAERGGWFDPDVQRPAVARLELLEPLWEGDQPVRVRFASERENEGFIMAASWYADAVVAAVDVPCPVEEVS